ncbi:aldo/keto reductase [Daejeonia sp. YH14]|uniref:aldo/keto reductase n=1 Tax=Daejeonia sp. YH14 TaxID=3439042 RepID=UPI003F49AB98
MNQLTYQLNNGNHIPRLGFGTWESLEEEGYNAVSTALETGYRHIDTAAAYKNEIVVGRAIKDSGVPREEIFLTTKLWNSERGYDKTLAAFQNALVNLGTDYLDLYLIHWPANKKQYDNWKEINADTWRAFEKLFQEGKIKNIGVSNFLPHHLEALMETARILPCINQIEHHPGYMQQKTVDFCKNHDILVEAWSPLGRGNVLKNETITGIAEKYGKTPAQICIRWNLQLDLLPLPKSVTPERIKSNFEVFDFEISEADMERISSLPEIGFTGLNPDEVDF